MLEATSTLAPQGMISYSVMNLIDDRPGTAWVEGADGAGKGERVSFELEPNAQDSTLVFVVDGVRIQNGFCRTEAVFNKNSRVKSLGVLINGQLLGHLPLNDQMEVQDFKLPQLQVIKPGEEIIFEIQDTYKGGAYEDTCISELYPLGYWHAPAAGAGR
jgi:hypothetical protein